MDETLNPFIDAVLEEEKKEFVPGIETFEMHAGRIRQEITDSMQQFEQQYSNGYETIEKTFKLEGLQPPTVRPEALQIFDDPIAFEKALEQGKSIQQLLGFSPETMKKFFEVGLKLVKEGNFAKAKDVFYFLVTLASETPAFWLGLGFSNARLNNFDEARGAFQQVIDLDPKNGDAYLGCMNALLKQNSPNEALRLCEEGLAVAMANQNEPWAGSLQSLLEEAQKYLKNHFN